ncbi:MULTISPECIES: hypothetical protein [unclassified Janthinobacterium]|uniref:hypothetical protein n=1 Tax=unclassified Janthinobacterium TaxID=2610881 RepID=UPI002712376E|nr:MULTISPECIES: hypothetical protein [unclassified Janthinobacterium]MDO8065120.1 hypothetical protein [Janthinobacterium sp. SUN206]MDO8071473.1 hypothetical protein [Janthinobacterium sp. SUN176]
MNEELTLQRFERVVNYDDFVALALELSTSPQQELFNFLFTQSISSGRGASVAACLLVEIDPTPTRSCEELLAEIAKSKWNVSTKEVPFFLISWFCKHFLNDAYRSFMQEASLTHEQKQRVGTIIYWTLSPTANLIRSFHDWPWHETNDSE